jgi:hypothetical protein
MANLSWMSFDAATATAVVTGVIVGLLGVLVAKGGRAAPQPAPARVRPRR